MTRDRFGDLRFFSRPGERRDGEPDVPAPLVEAAFGIERIGGVHPEVVSTGSSFHIVKLTSRRAAMHRSFEEASAPIRHRISRARTEENIQAFIEEMREESDVQENLALLENAHLDIPEGDPPRIGLPDRHGHHGPLAPPRPAPPNAPDTPDTPSP